MGDILAIYALLSMMIGVVMIMINVCKDINMTNKNIPSNKKINWLYILFPIAVLVIYMEKVFSNALDQMY